MQSVLTPETTSGQAPVRMLRDDGTLESAPNAGLSDDLAIALYAQMVLARTLSERLVELQRGGRIDQHSAAIGEEAAIVGAAAAMRDEDWVWLGSREFAAALWRGLPLAAYVRHVFGRGRDMGKARNAPDPPFWRPALVPSASPLVGTQIPHAVGGAWAARLRGKDVAALVFFGEGATSTSDFHTGMSFAGATRAPVVALCRNNGWAASTPARRQTASKSFALKGIAYGLSGVRVDGTDVIAVLDVVRAARARAATGAGGTLVEAVAVAGEQSEPAANRSLLDPIERLRRHLDVRGLWTGDREQQLRTDVGTDVDAALNSASEADSVPPDTLFDDVFEAPPWHLVQQREAMKGGVRS